MEGHEGREIKFYFCETCGKRVTDIEISRGEGRDKKLKGVHCKNCAVGVTTVEFDAISVKDLAKPAQPSSPRERPSGIAAAAVKRPHHASRAPVPKKKSAMPVMAIAGVAVIGAAGLAFAWMSSSKNSDETKPPAVAADPEKSAPVVAVPSHQTPELKPPELPAKADPEIAAKADYARLVKFDGISETNYSARIAAVTAFLKDHEQSAYAFPARALLDELKKLAALPNAPATSVAPVAPVVAVPQPAVETPKPAAPENQTTDAWRDLFDGKTLDGWQATRAKWGVTDGAIVNVSTDSGARLETIASFDDFEFTCEIQNSNHYAVLQLRDLGVSFKLRPRDGAWDTVVVKAAGKNVQCTLNGTALPISDDADDNLGGLNGRIAYYIKGGSTIKLRNIKLRRIPHQ